MARLLAALQRTPVVWHVWLVLAAVPVTAGARMMGWYAPTASLVWAFAGGMPWLARVAWQWREAGRPRGLPAPRGTVPVATRVEPGKSIYDQIGERGRLITLRREVVRSKPEKRIADFLFKRGIDYVYEMPIDGATPDFYLPASNIIIEHWGMEHRRYKQRRWEKTRMYRSRGYLVVETEKSDVPRLERALEMRLLEADPHIFERTRK